LTTAPPTNSKGSPGRNPRQPKKDLLPLLKPASKQRDRQGIGQKLASALIGRKVDLRSDGRLWDRATRSMIVEDGEAWRLVDPETGEVHEATGPRRAINYAYLLAKAAKDENHVSGMFGAGEEPDYQGGSALFKPSLRLDPNWAETMRRRSRKGARIRTKAMERELPQHEAAAIAEGRMNWRLGWKLLTLTFPHPPGMGTIEQLKIFNGAFRRLTKTELWGKVWGGIKGVEDKLTAEGAHVHGHLLLLMRYTDREAIREAWKACLDAQVKKLDLSPLDWTAGDGLPLVDIRQVKDNPRKRPDAVSWEIALDEVSKYITKTTDLLQPHPTTGAVVSAETLLELCDVKRWPRMFELLGKARSAAAPAERAFLDTSCISVAAGPRPDNFNDLEWVMERIKGIHFGEDQPPVASDFEPDDRKPPPKGTKPDTWRELMDRTTLEAWCKIIDERAKRAQDYRLRQLKGEMPRLFLQNLKGEVVANQNFGPLPRSSSFNTKAENPFKSR